jgi:putative salt-induced outer membrane protein YdiY
VGTGRAAVRLVLRAGLLAALIALPAVLPAAPEAAKPATDESSLGSEGTGRNGLSDKDAPRLDWVPPEDGFDWIQLKSGEWLKGRIKAMQDRELEFDSEELDLLTFDWEDVRQLRSPRRIDLLLDFIDEASKEEQKKRGGFLVGRLPDKGEELSGIVTITPDEVRVVDGVVNTIIPRTRLQSLTPSGSREIDYWSGNASIGLTLRSGNLEQVEYNAMFYLQRRTPATRLSLNYIGNVSSVDDVESANNHRANLALDIWVSGRLYLILPSLEYFRDPYQNISRRITLGGGLGYDFVDRSDLEWSVSMGPAQQWVEFESAQPGEPTDSSSGAFVVSSRLDWDITKRLDLIVEYRGQLTKKEVGETTHHFSSTLSVELTKAIDLDISFVWDRIENPKVGEDGVQPEPNDYRFVFGFGMDF